jgi:hypothetical protein
MFPTPLKTFVHPGGVYRLEYPAHWDQIVQDNGKSCGFGPHERDDVGLWISLMPVSVDSDRLADELPRFLGEAMPRFQAGEPRKDTSLRHHGYKADMNKKGEGGHYWIIAGGDVVLFASSQVPAGERDTWNPLFDQLLASLQITRDEELALRKLTCDVLEILRDRHPDQDFQVDEQGIRGKNQVVYLSNLYREVKAAPHRRAQIIQHFVDSAMQSTDLPMGHETWEEVQPVLLPMLKPKGYINPDTATRHLQITEWLADIIIVYVIRSSRVFRFVTSWDVNRWGTDAQTLHQLALNNLAKLPWPGRLEGSRERDGGRVIIVATDDSLASSRLLHPDLYRLFSGPLGSPFWAGIPDRDTLVVYSDRRKLKQRIERQLRIDNRKAAYPISPRPFLVTADGIAPAPPSRSG